MATIILVIVVACIVTEFAYLVVRNAIGERRHAVARAAAYADAQARYYAARARVEGRCSDHDCWCTTGE